LPLPLPLPLPLVRVVGLPQSPLPRPAPDLDGPMNRSMSTCSVGGGEGDLIERVVGFFHALARTPRSAQTWSAVTRRNAPTSVVRFGTESGAAG
jgi:hypothetical protein